MWQEIRRELLSESIQEDVVCLSDWASQYNYESKVAYLYVANGGSAKPTIDVSFTCDENINPAPLFALKSSGWALGKIYQHDSAAVISIEVNQALLNCTAIYDILRVSYERLGYKVIMHSRNL